ncbi:peptide chain release factor N(5)-glutamine methyltransferase [Moraxella atlantae]|uniref:peptide chain release factor N(5)-glutamine methyltransferase n=1 Tax=Faucicola atlantae TaxID=34059 RepID=UPI0037527F36
MKNSITIKQLLAESSPVDRHMRQQWLLHCLNQPLGYLISHGDDTLSDKVLANYRAGLAQLAQDIPLAYIIGRQMFWRHEFLVNEHTLIPRPDSERLVETVLDVLNNPKNSLSKNHTNQPKQLLDLGTGSGCLAISLALELPDWHITAVDISTDALQVAQQNVTALQANNVTLRQGSWFVSFAAMPSPPQFEVIISNPPYIAADDTHLAQLHAEPLRALVAADNGLADIAHIIKHSREFLVAHGLLAFEHGYQQGGAVRKLLAEAGFDAIQTVRDYGGNERVTFGFA